MTAPRPAPPPRPQVANVVLAIGHCRYSTTGSTTWENAQPVFRNTAAGTGVALGHNGNLVNTAEWKRRQGAIGPKITGMAFGRDRRLPITNRYRG